MQYKYGLIGEKLGHSFSPMIHAQLGNSQYALIPLAPEEVGAFICDTPFLGINVTIPYKQTVMEYCDCLSDEVKEIGCVNTIVKKSDGTICGYNTDAYGMEQLIRKAGILVRGKRVLILGGGGTSLTARYVAKKMGAKEVNVVSRKGPIYYEQLSEYADTQVIIDTTSVGMNPNNDGAVIDLDMFLTCEGVVDVVYNPLSSDLILSAKKRGIPCIGGLYMLVAQAWRAAELFAGREIAETKVEQAYQMVLQHIKNVVLIGMPGSGKSVIGRQLARKLNKTFVDTDNLIEQEAGKTIPEIFKESGESVFRKLEEDIVAQVAKCSGQVIATGGGAILKEESVRRLQQNAVVYFVMRDIEELATNGRPLSTNQEALFKLYEERLPIYTSVADKKIDNNTSVEDTVRKIEEDFGGSLNENFSD